MFEISFHYHDSSQAVICTNVCRVDIPNISDGKTDDLFIEGSYGVYIEDSIMDIKIPQDTIIYIHSDVATHCVSTKNLKYVSITKI